jgi:hypothetical protein
MKTFAVGVFSVSSKSLWYERGERLKQDYWPTLMQLESLIKEVSDKNIERWETNRIFIVIKHHWYTDTTRS